METATRRATVLAATADEEFTRALRGLNFGPEVTLRLCSRRRDLVEELTRASAPDEVVVLLLDDEMMDVRGQPLIRTAQVLRPGIKILFVARTSGAEVDARREGVFFFLVKPVEAELLRKVVEKAVEHESTLRRRAAV